MAVLLAALLRPHVTAPFWVTPAGVTVEEPFRPGLAFNQSDILCRRTVVIVPGFVSSALEVWAESPCSERTFAPNFRKRLFGPQMLLSLLEDPECYFRLASLDADTARDPNEAKLRPATGLSAIDYVVPGYWVWAKVFRNLADIGYTSNSLVAAPYDWRLAPEDLEATGYFDDLRDEIEHAVQRSRRRSFPQVQSPRQRDDEGCDRVVLVTHSYGTPVLQSFLHWVARRGGDSGWVASHVHAIMHVGGLTLGMPKAAAALLSGEFRDTAELPAPIRLLVDRSMPRQLRARAFRSWTSLWAMLPRVSQAHAWTNVLNVSNDTLPELTTTQLNGTMLRLLLKGIAKLSNNGLLVDRSEADSAGTGPTLPQQMRPAPRATVYCLYGVNRPTEVGYTYTRDKESGLMRIDVDRADRGVTIGNGDGTVPLSSLGYGCRSQRPNSWSSRFGRVVTVEYDQPSGPRAPGADAESTLEKAVGSEENFEQVLSALGKVLDGATPDVLLRSLDSIAHAADPRGGTTSTDHVDILGNYELIEAILTVAATSTEVQQDRVRQRIISNIDAVTAGLDAGGEDA